MNKRLVPEGLGDELINSVSVPTA